MRQQLPNTSDKHWEVGGPDTLLGCCGICTEVTQKDRANGAETERGVGGGVNDEDARQIENKING